MNLKRIEIPEETQVKIIILKPDKTELFFTGCYENLKKDIFYPEISKFNVIGFILKDNGSCVIKLKKRHK